MNNVRLQYLLLNNLRRQYIEVLWLNKAPKLLIPRFREILGSQTILTSEYYVVKVFIDQKDLILIYHWIQKFSLQRINCKLIYFIFFDLLYIEILICTETRTKKKFLKQFSFFIFIFIFFSEIWLFYKDIQ